MRLENYFSYRGQSGDPSIKPPANVMDCHVVLVEPDIPTNIVVVEAQTRPYPNPVFRAAGDGIAFVTTRADEMPASLTERFEKGDETALTELFVPDDSIKGLFKIVTGMVAVVYTRENRTFDLKGDEYSPPDGPHVVANTFQEYRLT